MLPQKIEDNILYKIQRRDVPKTGDILADAFLPDPVWHAVFDIAEMAGFRSFFRGPALYGLKYGKAYAPTENIEGLAVWVPGRYARMTFLRTLKSGTVFSAGKLKMKTLQKMNRVFSPLEKEREKHMDGRDYIYLMVLGVAPEHQGKGFGKRLLNKVLGEADRKNLPVYLETSTQKNVAMYERRGFKVIGEFIHPIIELPQWEMLREPGGY